MHWHHNLLVVTLILTFTRHAWCEEPQTNEDAAPPAEAKEEASAEASLAAQADIDAPVVEESSPKEEVDRSDKDKAAKQVKTDLQAAPTKPAAETGVPEVKAPRPAEKDKFDFFRGTTAPREITEWSLLISVFLVDEFVLGNQSPWPDQPLLDTRYKYFKPGESRKETVSGDWFYVAGGITAGIVAFVPNNKGWLNHVSYRHFKGFLEAALALTPFLTSLAKLSVGKERPYYDQYDKEGVFDRDPSERDDARMSFFSGHASLGFGISTYLNLFILRNLGDSKRTSLFWKVPICVLTYSLATYTAYTRIADHRHDVLDVTVGGLVGAGISLLLYALHDNWLGTFYHDSSKTKAKSKVQVGVFPSGVMLMARF